MHIETYEWLLYLHGDLDPGRAAEFEAHLAACDECLAAYVKIAAGEDILPEQAAAIRAPRTATRAVLHRLRWAGLTAALVLFFILVSVTPPGRTAWASFILSLEKFGNALSDTFQVSEENNGTIETVNQTAVAANGIEIKIDQVFVESDQIYFSMFIASDLIAEENSYLYLENDSLTLNGEETSLGYAWYGPRRGGIVPAETQENEIPVQGMFRIGYPKQDYSQEKNLAVHMTIQSLYHVGLRAGKYIEGPWEFDFVVDGTQLERQTHTIPLNVSFEEKGRLYALTELRTSPVRTRLTVERVNPTLFSEWVNQESGETERYYSSSTNLQGFVIADDQGNEAEISLLEYDQPFTSEVKVRYFLFSERDDNPYEWLKDADSLSVTPYVSSLDFVDTGVEGIKKNLALESFRIDLTNGENHNEK